MDGKVGEVIYRTPGGHILRYGLNWDYSMMLGFTLILNIPYWIMPYSVFTAFPYDAIMVGERIRIIKLYFRFRTYGPWKIWQMFVFHVFFGEKPYRFKLVATREEMENFYFTDR